MNLATPCSVTRVAPEVSPLSVKGWTVSRAPPAPPAIITARFIITMRAPPATMTPFGSSQSSPFRTSSVPPLSSTAFRTSISYRLEGLRCFCQSASSESWICAVRALKSVDRSCLSRTIRMRKGPS